MEKEESCLVELWNNDQLFGVIIPMKTGIVWSNQTGGVCCFHPELEGIFVPLSMSYYDVGYDQIRGEFTPDLLADFWFGLFGKASEEEGKGIIKEFFSAHDRLQSIFDVPDKLPEHWGEAWVPVKIKEGAARLSLGEPALKPFEGMEAILVYTNSD